MKSPNLALDVMARSREQGVDVAGGAGGVAAGGLIAGIWSAAGGICQARGEQFAEIGKFGRDCLCAGVAWLCSAGRPVKSARRERRGEDDRVAAFGCGRGRHHQRDEQAVTRILTDPDDREHLIERIVGGIQYGREADGALKALM
jgi:hypothetical protein